MLIPLINPTVAYEHSQFARCRIKLVASSAYTAYSRDTPSSLMDILLSKGSTSTRTNFVQNDLDLEIQGHTCTIVKRCEIEAGCFNLWKPYQMTLTSTISNFVLQGHPRSKVKVIMNKRDLHNIVTVVDS